MYKFFFIWNQLKVYWSFKALMVLRLRFDPYGLKCALNLRWWLCPTLTCKFARLCMQLSLLTHSLPPLYLSLYTLSLTCVTHASVASGCILVSLGRRCHGHCAFSCFHRFVILMILIFILCNYLFIFGPLIFSHLSLNHDHPFCGFFNLEVPHLASLVKNARNIW